MVYQVLARKWRPRNFSEILGQTETVTILSNSLISQKLHHAYLFTGTRGIGKTTIARVLAKAMVCETGISAKPCNNCELCQSVNEGNCVDVIEIDAASRTKVEDTRLILDNLSYAPSLARFKIYIIDEVHMLSNHSFNALLKSLEEPPIHVKFLLATTDPQKVPITVLSRCLHFKLRMFSIESICNQLQKILLVESKSFEPSAIMQIATFANGSMRDALSLLERVLAFGNNAQRITLMDVSKVVGVPIMDRIVDLIQAIIQGNFLQVMDVVNSFFIDGCDLFAVLQELQRVLKNIAILQLIPELTMTDLINKNVAINKEAFDLLSQLVDKISKEDLQIYYDIALSGFKNLAFTPDLQVGFEMVVLKMMAFNSKNTKVDKNTNHRNSKHIIINNKTNNCHNIDDNNINKINNINSGNNISNEGDINKHNINFLDLIPKLKISGLTKELAENSVFELMINYNTEKLDKIYIKLIIDHNKKILVTKNNIENLETAFSEFFNKETTIKVETIDLDQFPDLSSQTIKFQIQQKKQNFIDKDPILNNLIQEFNAEIQEITEDKF